MLNTEQLSEILIASQRENGRLRIEVGHATLLFRALNSLLSIETRNDPFAAVFAALREVFDFTHAMVLAEQRRGHLECIAASPPHLVGIAWNSGPMFARAMNGRVSATLKNSDLGEWTNAPEELSPAQPALCLPMHVRDRRGLLMLLQAESSPGFDRNHVVLAKKFSLLASHALAASEARKAASELRQKKELEVQNIRFDAALNNMSQGLVMFDAAAALVVCNDQYLRMYDLPPDKVRPGCSLIDLIKLRQELGNAPSNVPEYIAQVKRAVENAEVREREVECGNGRIIRIVLRPMPDGGWVTTHEDITERRHNESKLRFLALHDPLTGVANRTQFLDRVNSAYHRLNRTGEAFVVFLLDLDRFKNVNDTLGHAAGDDLLVETAKRLQKTLAHNESLARLGGDEFAILQWLPNDPGPHLGRTEMLVQNATSLAERIKATLAAPFEIGGHKIVIGTSIGIAVAPDHASETGDLLKKADLALYGIKAGGRNGHLFFNSRLVDEADERRVLELDLREAIERGQFVLHYQSIIDLSTGRPCGVEALVRWNHPRFGMISPERFISLAEDTGLIVPLGEWIVRTACHDAVRWPSHIRVAVNISPMQFRNSELENVIWQSLDSSGLDPSRLEVEITERILLDPNTDHVRLLRGLRNCGISIALDDFGTGYSSLSYLREFKFNKIKIDRSFTRDLTIRPDCAAIIAAVVNLGRALDITTLAEGVETQDQLEVLRLTGVGQAQGFLFDRPKPVMGLDWSDDSIRNRAGAAA